MKQCSHKHNCDMCVKLHKKTQTTAHSADNHIASLPSFWPPLPTTEKHCSCLQQSTSHCCVHSLHCAVSLWNHSLGSASERSHSENTTCVFNPCRTNCFPKGSIIHRRFYICCKCTFPRQPKGLMPSPKYGTRCLQKRAQRHIQADTENVHITFLSRLCV